MSNEIYKSIIKEGETVVLNTVRDRIKDFTTSTSGTPAYSYSNSTPNTYIFTNDNDPKVSDTIDYKKLARIIHPITISNIDWNEHHKRARGERLRNQRQLSDTFDAGYRRNMAMAIYEYNLDKRFYNNEQSLKHIGEIE